MKLIRPIANQRNSNVLLLPVLAVVKESVLLPCRVQPVVLRHTRLGQRRGKLAVKTVQDWTLRLDCLCFVSNFLSRRLVKNVLVLRNEF